MSEADVFVEADAKGVEYVWAVQKQEGLPAAAVSRHTRRLLGCSLSCLKSTVAALVCLRVGERVWLRSPVCLRAPAEV